MIPEFIHDIKFLLSIKEFFNVDRRWSDDVDIAGGQRVYREGTRKRDLILEYVTYWFVALIIIALFLSPIILLVLALLEILK